MAKGTVNKVIIMGRLGQDPESRATASGMTIVTLNIATTELGKKGADGKREFETEWHKVTLFGYNAEHAQKYLTKGSSVHIFGRLKTQTWDDKNTGEKRYSTGIIADEMTFVGGNKQNQQPQNDPFRQQPTQPFNQPTQQPAQQPAQQQPQNQPSNGGGFDDFDDDIPF